VETLINRPLLSGLPIARTNPETGEHTGVTQQTVKQYMDLMAIGRPYVDAWRKMTETTARSVPQGADEWLERNYDVSRGPRSSWLGEQRSTGGFVRKMILGGAAVPTERETEIANHIVRLNRQLEQAGRKPYWFSPIKQLISAEANLRYTDEEYEMVRQIAGSTFVDAYGRLPTSKNPEERMLRLQYAWEQAKAKAKSNWRSEGF
jgi:hypothetical protein